MADLYKIIDELLKDKGVSGAQMSRDLGMSRSFMTELRKGRAKSIKTETAQKIADYFNVSVDYLLGNVSDPFFLLDNDRILREINSYEDEEKPLVNDDEELTEYLEVLKTRPEMRMLFQLSKDATKEDVEAAVRIIEALRNK